MDKDKLDIQGILSNLTTDNLRSAHVETFQQLLSALCLMAVGLFLALVGLLGIFLKMGRLVKCTLACALKPLAFFVTVRKGRYKDLVEINK